MSNYDIPKDLRPEGLIGSKYEQAQKQRVWNKIAPLLEFTVRLSGKINNKQENTWVSGLQQIVLRTLNLAMPILAKNEVRSEKEEVIPNEHLTSYLQTIQTAINTYIESHGVPPSWNRDSQHISTKAYIDIMNRPLSPEQEDQFFESITPHHLTPTQRMQEREKFTALGFTEKPLIRSLLQVMYAGSFTSDVESLLRVVFPQKLMDEMIGAHETMLQKDEDLNVYPQLVQEIEAQYLAQRELKPLTTADVLLHLLEKNQGDLGIAIHQLSRLYEYTARAMPISGEHQDPDVERVKWMQKYIRDEYSTVNSYSETSVDKHTDWMKNRVGLPYHFAYATDLLRLFPAEAVTMLVAGEYSTYFSQHGATKAMADLLFLRELKKIEKQLEKYVQ